MTRNRNATESITEDLKLKQNTRNKAQAKQQTRTKIKPLRNNSMKRDATVLRMTSAEILKVADQFPVTQQTVFTSHF